MDGKEEIWLTNVKYLWVSLNTSWALVFMCTISKVIGINGGEGNMSTKQEKHKWS